MKLITLNTWGGRGGRENLMDFFSTRRDTDIFCLQEVWSNGNEEMLGKRAGGVEVSGVVTHLLEDIKEKLPDHKVLFHPHFRDYYGLAMLIHPSLELIGEGEIFVYKQKGFESEEDYGNHARNIQFASLRNTQGESFTVINFHGLWNGQGKSDSNDRLQQSTNIFEFTQTLDTPYIIAGDFNLRPDTESLKILERAKMRNLISEYNIISTRTSFYQKEEKYADYVLTSDGIEVNDFKVLPEEVSDHAALQLTFILSAPIAPTPG